MKLEINLNGSIVVFHPSPNTFLEFEDQLVRTFHLVSLKGCEIKYQDFENDMVTISNNEEYTFMLNMFKNNKAEVILIFVKEKSQPSPKIKYDENLKDDQLMGTIPFDSSLNLDASDNQKNIFKEKPVKKKLNAHFKEEEFIPHIEELSLPTVNLGKKESSVNLESKRPYSDIPCIKCKGLGKKREGKPCKKCDATGKMKNNKKLKKIEYLVEKKLQALLSELEKQKNKKEAKTEVSLDNFLKPSEPKAQNAQIRDPLKFSLPLFLQGESAPSSSTGGMVHKGFKCDGCNMNPIVGFRFHCTLCVNFDFCEKCENIYAHPHPFLKIRKVLDEGRSSNLSSLNQSQTLFMENVKDFKVQVINVSNNIIAMVKKTYTNTISIKNSGSNKWPDNSELKCITGLHKDISEGIPSLLPGEEYKVNLVLPAPNNPGTYACSWKMSYRIKNDTCFFGPKIDCNINVEEDPTIFTEKARELKKLFEGKDSGEIKDYLEVVKKYEKYSIQELYQRIMDRAKSKKQKNAD